MLLGGLSLKRSRGFLDNPLLRTSMAAKNCTDDFQAVGGNPELGKPEKDTLKTEMRLMMVSMMEKEMSEMNKKHMQDIEDKNRRHRQDMEYENGKHRQDIEDIQRNHKRTVEDLVHAHEGKITDINKKHEETVTKMRKEMEDLSKSYDEEKIRNLAWSKAVQKSTLNGRFTEKRFKKYFEKEKKRNRGEGDDTP